MSADLAIDRAHALELLRDMVLVRRFEERCVELYSASKIRGFMHLYIGEEAVAAGVLRLAAPGRRGRRDLPRARHALLRGVTARSIMAEMFGVVEGAAAGVVARCTSSTRARRFYGGNAIVGGGLPIAVGLALADKMQRAKTGHRVLLRRGRGRRGRVPRVHEPRGALAATGAVLLREQPVRDGHRARTLGVGDRHRAQGVRVRDAGVAGRRHGCRRRRAGGTRARRTRFATAAGPICSSCGPTVPGPLDVRPRAVSRRRTRSRRWKHRDPIPVFVERCRAAGLVTDGDMDAIEADVAAEIDDAVVFAEAGTAESIEDLTRFVYSEVAAP